MFPGAQYDGGEAVGKAMLACFIVWLVWSFAVAKFCNLNGGVKEASGGSYALSLFGSGAVFILLSCILMLGEFHFAFRNLTIYHTSQISAGITLFWAVFNLVVAAIIAASLIHSVERGVENNDPWNTASLTWWGSTALSFLGIGLMWLGITFIPDMYTATNLYSLWRDIKELIIGLIVLPFFIAIVWGVIQWSLT